MCQIHSQKNLLLSQTRHSIMERNSRTSTMPFQASLRLVPTNMRPKRSITPSSISGSLRLFWTRTLSNHPDFGPMALQSLDHSLLRTLICRICRCCLMAVCNCRLYKTYAIQVAPLRLFSLGGWFAIMGTCCKCHWHCLTWASWRCVFLLDHLKGTLSIRFGHISPCSI